MTFSILYNDQFLEHHDVGYHPECPDRLEAIKRQLTGTGLWDRATIEQGREATIEELAANHAPRYVEQALDHMLRAPGRFDADTFFSQGSRLASLLAAGGTVDMVHGIIDRDCEFGFALPRPPGHHATPGRAMGFCIFNNIAIATRAALARNDIERVFIYDWDVHHGNGTQDAFYDSDQVLYVSTHQWPFFPGSGLSDETGHKAGEGYTMNFPWPPGAGDEEYSFVLREAIIPLAEEFKPDLILISAGFDAHGEDLLGSMRLTNAGYTAMTRLLSDAANKLCDGRIGFVLEGGYNIEAEAQAINEVIETMLGAEAEIPTSNPTGSHRDIVDRTRLLLTPHWKSIF